MAKSISITDIARLAGVSAATVSNALQGKKNVGEKTRQKIQAIASEHHYHPNVAAQGLRAQHSKLVGILIHDFQNVFSSEIADEINTSLHARGYSLVAIANNNESLLNSHLFDGLIIFNYQSTREHLKEIVTAADLPTVIMADKLDLPNVENIVMANREPIQMLCRLYERTDHKRICVFRGRDDSYNSNVRWAAVRDYFKAKHDVDITPHTYNAEFRTEPAYAKARELLQADAYDFFFCMNDMMAYGVYRAARELGLTVGKQISVMGYDNTQHRIDIFQPKLTTVDPDMKHWGELIANSIVDRIEGAPAQPGRTVVATSRVVLGDSVHLVD